MYVPSLFLFYLGYLIAGLRILVKIDQIRIRIQPWKYIEPAWPSRKSETDPPPHIPK